MVEKKEELKMTEGQLVRVPNEAFYANEFTLHFDKDVVLDFKKISPRFDKNEVSEVTEHKTIIMDIILFKNLIMMGYKFIDEFEKKYGEIKNPDFLQKFKDDTINQIKQLQKKLEKNDNSADYLG